MKPNKLTDMKNELVLLPEEVKELAVKVPEKKQHEVQEILTQIFQGTNDWESKIDAIEVKDISDAMSIQMADAARLNVKNARLQGEKLFDAKRSEVQLRMTDDKLEDALWLKSKQIMQIKFKALEEKAAFKANFIKRHESEQKELKTKLRLEKVLKFNPDVNTFEIANLSDEMFDKVLAAYEKEYNDKIEAEKKAEQERIAAEKARIEEEKRIRAENERLEKEAQERDRLDKIRIEKEEQERKKREEKARKEREEYEAKLKAEREEREKLEREEKAKREKLQSQLKAKEEKERKEKQQLIDEEQKQLKAEKAAQLAPDKDKLLAFASTINEIPLPSLKSKESISILQDAIVLLSKVDSYIKEKVENL